MACLSQTMTPGKESGWNRGERWITTCYGMGYILMQKAMGHFILQLYTNLDSPLHAVTQYIDTEGDEQSSRDTLLAV